MSTELGIAFGIAAFGSLGAVVYRHELDGRIPSGVPEQVATNAGDGIATAFAAAQGLPATVAAAVLDAARAAFTEGLNMVGAVGVAGFLVLALLAARVLRSTGPDSTVVEAPAEVREPAGIGTDAR